MLWEEIRRIFDEDTSHPFYWRFHAVFMLVMFEIFLALSKTSQVAIYNGSDVWFAVIHKYIPYGTVIISIPLALYFFLPIYQDWTGLRSKDERETESMFMRGVPGMPAALKPVFRPDWLAMVRIGVEGFLYGGLIFIFLRWIVFAIVDNMLAGDFFIPTPIDANPAMLGLHSNVLQNIALSLGAGFYDEFLFRKLLLTWLEEKMPRFIQMEILQTFTAVFISSLIFAISHYLYPFGDTFSTYTMLYRFLFGVIMCIIFYRRGFAVTAWSHTSHDLFYFWLV